MKRLLALKAEYKQLTGQEYKPGAAPAPKSPVPAAAAADLQEKVAAQGDVVRKLKAEKAPKVGARRATSTRLVLQDLIVAPCQDRVDEAVKTLLDLKSRYKSITGEEYKPVAAAGGEDKSRKDRENKSEKQGAAGGGEGKKGKGDKGNQAKEPSGGAGGSGDGQGAKKQTR